MNKKAFQTNQIPSKIRQHFLKHQESGETIKSYCRKTGVSVKTFYSWRKRYKNELQKSPTKVITSKNQVSFASLGTLQTHLPSQKLLDIQFPGGTEVVIVLIIIIQIPELFIITFPACHYIFPHKTCSLENFPHHNIFPFLLS